MSDQMITELLQKSEEFYNDDCDTESVSSQYLRKKVQIAREKIEETANK